MCVMCVRDIVTLHAYKEKEAPTHECEINPSPIKRLKYSPTKQKQPPKDNDTKKPKIENRYNKNANNFSEISI